MPLLVWISYFVPYYVVCDRNSQIIAISVITDHCHQVTNPAVLLHFAEPAEDRPRGPRANGRRTEVVRPTDCAHTAAAP